MDHELLKQVEAWHQENAHAQIIAALSAVAWQELDYEATGYLARAYNNIGNYKKAIERLQKVAAQGKDDPLWYIRIGYAFYYNEQYAEAQNYLATAVKLVPEDDEAKQLLSKAQERVPKKDLTELIVDYLACPCQIFAPMVNDEALVDAYREARIAGKKEGFTPVLISVDDVLWDQLTEVAPKGMTANDYRQALLTVDLADGDEILREKLAEMQVDSFDAGLSWEDDVVGEIDGGEMIDRLGGYWTLSDHMTYPVILAKIPVKDPWQIFAYLPIGGWNECPNAEEMMAIAKKWYEKYGAVAATVSHDVVEFVLDKPLDNQNEALALALEQFAFCPDRVDQSAEGTAGALADTLLKSVVWYFWWD